MRKEHFTRAFAAWNGRVGAIIGKAEESIAQAKELQAYTASPEGVLEPTETDVGNYLLLSSEEVKERSQLTLELMSDKLFFDVEKSSELMSMIGQSLQGTLGLIQSLEEEEQRQQGKREDM